MKRRLPLLFLAAFLGSCRHRDPALDDVVARIGGEPVTRAQLIALLKELPPRVQARYATQEGLRQLLEETLDRRAQAAEARKRGLDKDPVVKDKITTYVEQKTAALDQQIKSLKAQKEELKRKAPEEILSAELFDLRTRTYEGQPGEAELREAYEAWIKERTASEPRFKAPVLDVVRKDLTLELIKRKVREDIRRSAGVTLYTDALLGP